MHDNAVAGEKCSYVSNSPVGVLSVLYEYGAMAGLISDLTDKKATCNVNPETDLSCSAFASEKRYCQ